jgi:hypothetical protein
MILKDNSLRSTPPLIRYGFFFAETELMTRRDMTEVIATTGSLRRRGGQRKSLAPFEPQSVNHGRIAGLNDERPKSNNKPKPIKQNGFYNTERSDSQHNPSY